MPFIGDFIKAMMPCGFASTSLYVLGILMGFQISPLVNLFKGIFISNRFKVSCVASSVLVLLKLVFVNVFSALL